MALPEYSDLAALPEFKALPVAEKQKMTSDYWADYEKENPDQKDFVAQQRDVSTKYVDIRDKYRDATPIEKKLLQPQYDDTEFTLLAAEGMKTGKLSAEEFNTELASRKAQRATDQESFNKTVSLFDPKVNEQMQPAYNSMTRLATEGDVFGNLGVTGKVNDAVSNFLPGGQDQPVSTAKKEYEGLKTRMADNFGIKPEEVDDMIKHRMDLQEAPVSRDATGQVHIKSDLLDQGPEAVTKAIGESQLPDSIKATYTPEKVKERLDTFKQAVVERVKTTSPDLYKWMGLGANYKQSLDENMPNPGSLIDQDYAKVRKHLNDSKTKQLSEGLLGGLEGLAEKGERAAGALHEGFSLTTWLPEGTLGPKYVSPLTERASYVAGRVKMRSDLTNLSHDILKDKVEIFGTDAATIGQGIYSGVESAGLMYATAGLGELVMPTSKLAGMAGKTKWLAEGVKAAAEIAPMATIYGVDDGTQVYEQARKAGKSETESLFLGAKSAVAETGITMLASMAHLSGTESSLAAFASREVREKVKRTMLQSAAKFGGTVSLGVTGEQLEENLITFTKELTVQSKLNPQWTSNDMDKAIRDTAVATLFASGPLSTLEATQEVISNTYNQTTDELEATANKISIQNATQENLPETQDEGGTVAPPSDAGMVPAVQMSRSELEAAVLERRAELTDSEEDQAEVAELERPLEEIAAERNVELTEEPIQWAKPTEEELARAAALDAQHAEAANAPTTAKLEDFADPDTFYRVVVGDAAFQDIIDSGEVRTNSGSKPGETMAEKLAARPTLFPSFSRGKASMSYAQANPNNYIITSTDPSIQPSTSGRHGKGTTMFPTDSEGNHLPNLSGSKVNVYKHTGDGNYELVYSNGKVITKNEQNQTIPEVIAPAEAEVQGEVAPAIPEATALPPENFQQQNTQPQVPAAKATPETIVEEKKSLLSSRSFSAVAINQMTAELKNVSVSITSTVTETGAKATYTQPASEVIKEFKKEKSGYEALLACLDS